MITEWSGMDCEKNHSEIKDTEKMLRWKSGYLNKINTFIIKFNLYLSSSIRICFTTSYYSYFIIKFDIRTFCNIK